MQQLNDIKELEFLWRLGREETTVKILGTDFTFHTLTVDDETDTWELPAKEDFKNDIARFNAMRCEILSRAIVKINNTAIPETMTEQIKKLLGGMQQAALNKIFDAYQQLVEKQTKTIEAAEKGLGEQVPVAPSAPPPPPPTAEPTPPRMTLVQGGQQAPPPPSNEPAPPPGVSMVLAPPPAQPMQAAQEAGDDEAVSLVNPANLMGPNRR